MKGFWFIRDAVMIMKHGDNIMLVSPCFSPDFNQAPQEFGIIPFLILRKLPLVHVLFDRIGLKGALVRHAFKRTRFLFSNANSESLGVKQ